MSFLVSASGKVSHDDSGEAWKAQQAPASEETDQAQHERPHRQPRRRLDAGRGLT
jgi:hypothetical protein